MAVPTFRPRNSDRRSPIFRTPLSIGFYFRTFRMSVYLIFSDVKRLISHKDSKVDLMACQEGLDTIEAGAMMPGEQSLTRPLDVLDFTHLVHTSCRRDFAVTQSQLPPFPR